MNGQIYDSAIKRFLQADPIVQAPTFVLSYNRYSYVWNNPINMMDPTGYTAEGLDDFGFGDGEDPFDSSTWNNGSCGACGGSSSSDPHLGGANPNLGNPQPQSNSWFDKTWLGKKLNDINSKWIGSLSPDRLVDALGRGRISLKDFLNTTLNKTKEEADKIVSTFNNYMEREGIDLALRAGQFVGGGGQVLAGIGVCSGVASCIGGVFIAAKGIDNMQASWRGQDSFSQEFLGQAIGDEDIATYVNAGLDLGTSVYGLAHSVPKISSYGTKYNANWYKGMANYFEPKAKQMMTSNVGKGLLQVEALTATSTITDTYLRTEGQ